MNEEKVDRDVWELATRNVLGPLGPLRKMVDDNQLAHLIYTEYKRLEHST